MWIVLGVQGFALVEAHVLFECTEAYPADAREK